MPWHACRVDLDLSDSVYLFDLVSPHDRRREQAWERHSRWVSEVHAAAAENGRLWWLARNRENPDPALDAARQQASAVHQNALDHTVHGLAGQFRSARRTPYLHEQFAPYAALFLEWEATDPQQWRHAGPYSPWGIKKRILRSFVAYGVPATYEAQLGRLVLATVNRAQRCEDDGYVALARVLDGLELRSMLATVTDSADEAIRRRAEFVRWACDHPAEPITLASWRRYPTRRPPSR
jgi:hypothetical protein